MNKKVIAAAICFLQVFTSCAPSVSIEKLAFSMATSYDLTPEGQVLLSTQVIKPYENTSTVSSDIVGGENAISDVSVYTALGSSPADAAGKISTKTGRKLFTSHTIFRVFGDAFARNGVEEVIDLGLRQYQMRPNILMFVSKTTGHEIIQGVAPEDKIPAHVVENIVHLQRQYGFCPVITNLDFTNALSSKTAAPIMGVIEYVGNKSTSSGDVFKVSGTAIFKKDKLIGYLNEKETRGMQFIRSKITAGNMEVEYESHGKVALEILKSGSKIEPKFEDGILSINVIISVESNILMISDNLDTSKKPEIMDELGKLLSKEVKKEVEKTVDIAQKEYNADIFDFGEDVHRKYPKEWKELKSDWENIFPDIPVNIIVKSSVKRTGQTLKAIF